MNAPVTGSIGLIWDGRYRVVAKCPVEIQYGHSPNASGAALTTLAANERIPLPVGRPTYAFTTGGGASTVQLFEQ